MCGFVGYTDLNSERVVSRPLLAELTKSLIHRGPESEGYFLEGVTGLGFAANSETTEPHTGKNKLKI